MSTFYPPVYLPFGPSAGPVIVHTRWLIRRDMPQVMGIEGAGHEHPWGEAELLSVLRDRHCIGMVAEHGDRVVGFMVYELRHESIELLDLAVHPDCRRRGVGRQMVSKLVGKLSPGGRTRIGLYARETSLDCQLFFRAQGFRATALHRDFWEDTGEDGIRMLCRLAPPPCPREGLDDEEAMKWI